NQTSPIRAPTMSRVSCAAVPARRAHPQANAKANQQQEREVEVEEEAADAGLGMPAEMPLETEVVEATPLRHRPEVHRLLPLLRVAHAVAEAGAAEQRCRDCRSLSLPMTALRLTT